MTYNDLFVLANIILIICLIVKLYLKHNHLFTFAALIAVLSSAFMSYKNEYTVNMEFREVYFYFYTIILLNILTSDVEYRSIIKFILIISLILCCTIIIMTNIRVLRNVVQMEGSWLRVRNCLGVSWPTELAYVFMYIVFYYIYLRQKNISGAEFIFILLINVIMYYLTATRSVFFFAVSFLALYIVNSRGSFSIIKFNVLSKVLLALAIVGPILFLLLTNIYSYDLQLLSQANKLLSGRLALANDAINMFGANIFGKFLQWSTAVDKYDLVDSTYINILLQHGIIGFLVFYLSTIYFCFLAIKNRDMCMVLILIFAVTDMILNYNLMVMRYNYLFMILSYKSSFENRNI